jgi:hypothetical protein
MHLHTWELSEMHCHTCEHNDMHFYTWELSEVHYKLHVPEQKVHGMEIAYYSTRSE